MKTCPKCHRENIDEAVFCYKCGCNIDLEMSRTVEDTSLVSDEEKREYIRKNTYSLSGTIGMIISLVGAIMGIITFFCLNFLSIFALAVCILGVCLSHKGIYDGHGVTGLSGGILGIIISFLSIFHYIVISISIFIH